MEKRRLKNVISGIRFIRNSLYPVCVISGIRYIGCSLCPVCVLGRYISGIRLIGCSLYPFCAKKSKGGPFGNIENFSKKQYIRYTFYPEFVISGLR